MGHLHSSQPQETLVVWTQGRAGTRIGLKLPLASGLIAARWAVERGAGEVQAGEVAAAVTGGAQIQRQLG